MDCSWLVQLATHLQKHAPLAVQQDLVLDGAVLSQGRHLPQDSLGLRDSVGLQALLDAGGRPGRLELMQDAPPFLLGTGQVYLILFPDRLCQLHLMPVQLQRALHTTKENTGDISWLGQA